MSNFFFVAGFFSKERGTQPDECPAPAPWGGTINDARQPKNEKRGSRITSDIPTEATDEPRHNAQKNEPAAFSCGLPMLTREGKKNSIHR